ncbi:pyridoxal-phosphate dependent enzyme [Plantactinospora endophytica]|uniref:Threonine synthase n=1 Tax=Plantactinospora endophytica TaxID=673535 RepID=A0ABQ4E6Z8_9ACTN|nr:pyridoxal-phosphate dependent enzyme [Plantactinospora endophytica]GIG90453.1 threonine synthase [Plantactinospora endophytica]
MRDFTVHCVRCRRSTDFPAYRCPNCGSPLVLDLVPASADDCRHTSGRGLWRYAGMLPRTRHAVTLGEGATPLLPLRLDGRDAHVKLESLNPSLSFKDRAMALAVSAALDRGLDGLVLASTGNAAVSAATYAAAAGLRCRIFCATGSNAGTKLDTARAHGARVELVDGHYSDAYAAATRAEGEGWLNVTTTYRNPLLTEAYRPIAAELVAELGAVPDVVVVPVGAGPLLRGIWLGFTDLRDAGLTTTVPRMVGVQADACAPLVRAWGAADWESSLREPVVVAPTAATAIADALRGYEVEGLLTLAAARDSGGALVAVDEPAIAEAGRELARRGLFVEPAAAAAVAALATSAVPARSRAVAVLTGHGAKEPSVLAGLIGGDPAEPSVFSVLSGGDPAGRSTLGALAREDRAGPSALSAHSGDYPAEPSALSAGRNV